MSKPRKGDRVKVEFEGTIVYINDEGDDCETYEVEPLGFVPAGRADRTVDYIPSSLIKVLNPILKDGDVVIDEDNDVLVFKIRRGERGFSRRADDIIVYAEGAVRVKHVIGNVNESKGANVV